VGEPGPTTTTGRARVLRQSLTPAEATLWKRLKTWRAEGYHWRRQVPFRGWILDFACFKHRLIVEIDGSHHEVDPAQRERDAVRDRVLRREGFQVLRFTNFAVRHHLGNVLSEIDLAARAPTLAAPRPVPPDKREGAE
jgi:very-short-patch-repair endonuclease